MTKPVPLGVRLYGNLLRLTPIKSGQVDIEGAEPAVLPWLVSQENLSFVIFEAGSNAGHLWHMVEAKGLVTFGLCRNLFRLRVRRCRRAEEISGYNDLLALRLRNDEGAPDSCHPKRLVSLV